MDKIQDKDRSNNLPLARMILTHYLFKINIPEKKIHEIINYSDASSLRYNKKRMKEMIDVGDAKLMAVMNAINTQIYLKSNSDGKY